MCAPVDAVIIKRERSVVTRGCTNGQVVKKVVQNRRAGPPGRLAIDRRRDGTGGGGRRGGKVYGSSKVRIGLPPRLPHHDLHCLLPTHPRHQSID